MPRLRTSTIRTDLNPSYRVRESSNQLQRTLGIADKYSGRSRFETNKRGPISIPQPDEIRPHRF